MAQTDAQRRWYLRNKEKLLIKAKQYREANKESVAKTKKICYDRIKDTSEHKNKASKYGKKRRIDNLEHVKEIEKRSRIKHKDRISEYNKSKQLTPERLARTAVTRAVRRGDISPISTMKCKHCDNQATNYHHESYDEDKRLDVIPLCDGCHKTVHVGQ